MDAPTIVAYLISNFIIMLAVGRAMGVFFDKRRTPFFVMAVSYFSYFLLSSLTFLLLAIPFVNMLVSLGAFFIISLNIFIIGNYRKINNFIAR